jgi:hypothetical protein
MRELANASYGALLDTRIHQIAECAHVQVQLLYNTEYEEV